MRLPGRGAAGHPRPTGPGAARRSATAAVVGLLLGLVAADHANRALRISYREAPLPEDEIRAHALSGAASPLSPFEVVAIPPAPGPAADVYSSAAAELAHALELRTGRAPTIERGAAGAAAGRQVRITDADQAIPPGEVHIATANRSIEVRARTPLAAVHGIAFLTEQILVGIGDTELGRLDRHLRPAFEDRFVDLGGVGILADSAAWAARDYSHHSRAFLHVLGTEPPHVDTAAFSEVRAQFRAYVQRMASYGYNGIVFKGFLEFVDFDRVGSGQEVYPADSRYRERHREIRGAFGELFEYAAELGMKVVLSTDMVALTPPLEAYLVRRFGAIDAEDPAFWEVYRLALGELFESLPAVDGLMIRVGETGAVFNVEGWDYRSELHVRTVAALHAMLGAFTAAAR
jgi:hypothetical protein